MGRPAQSQVSRRLLEALKELLRLLLRGPKRGSSTSSTSSELRPRTLLAAGRPKMDHHGVRDTLRFHRSLGGVGSAICRCRVLLDSVKGS